MSLKLKKETPPPIVILINQRVFFRLLREDWLDGREFIVLNLVEREKKKKVVTVSTVCSVLPFEDPRKKEEIVRK